MLLFSSKMFFNYSIFSLYIFLLFLLVHFHFFLLVNFGLIIISSERTEFQKTFEASVEDKNWWEPCLYKCTECTFHKEYKQIKTIIFLHLYSSLNWKSVVGLKKVLQFTYMPLGKTFQILRLNTEIFWVH